MAIAAATSGASAGSNDPRAIRSREAILGAAIELLSQGREFSVTHLAESAGVSRRAVYLNFETLDNVLVQAVVMLLAQTFPERPFSLTGQAGPAGPPETLVRLTNHLGAHAGFYTAILTGSVAHRAVGHIRDTFHADTLEMLRTVVPDADDNLVDFTLYGVIGLCVNALTNGKIEADSLAAALWATLRRCLPRS